MLLESLPLETPFLGARAVFPQSRGMGWGKADRRPPIPLPTAMEPKMHYCCWLKRSWRQGFTPDKSRESHIPWAGGDSGTSYMLGAEASLTCALLKEKYTKTGLNQPLDN